MVALSTRRHPLVADVAASTDVADIADLPELLATIYDTTLAPDQWTDALGRCRAYVGGSAASLFFKSTGLSLGGIYATDGGISIDYGMSYFTEYGRIDPTRTSH